jgi:hypothetical protein
MGLLKQSTALAASTSSRQLPSQCADIATMGVWQVSGCSRMKIMLFALQLNEMLDAALLLEKSLLQNFKTPDELPASASPLSHSTSLSRNTL